MLDINKEYPIETKLTKEEQEEIDSLTEDEYKEHFNGNLEFGTGGMRGVMGVGPNRMNRLTIYRATLGFGRYLLENEPDSQNRGVVIAHDNRYNGELFQNVAANCLTSLGIKVYVFDTLRTTPELSFAVRYLNACGGINITASHNPKEYNGYKIYNSDGNQLILEQSNKVMEKISVIPYGREIDAIPDKSKYILLDNKVDDAFLKMVEETTINNNVDTHNLKIVYTPQHGTGYVPVTTILKRKGYNLIEVKEQCDPLPDFPNTLSPNPENKEAYDLACKYAFANNADIAISNDPDCDRIGVVCFKDNKAHYMTGNQTAACLIYYLLEHKKETNTLPNNGVIYNTIVTSPLGKLIAADYGVNIIQTLTGFKYIGDRIKKDTNLSFLMGYEESYGYLFNPEVRDKDGVQATLIICEMAAYFKMHHKTLIDVYEDLERKYGFFAESQKSFYKQGSEGAKVIKGIMDNLRHGTLDTIAGEKVATKEDYLLSKAVSGNKETFLDYEKSNVLRYVFADGSFVAIRPSGTEPKIKYYFAMKGKTLQEATDRLNKMEDFFLNK